MVVAANLKEICTRLAQSWCNINSLFLSFHCQWPEEQAYILKKIKNGCYSVAHLSAHLVVGGVFRGVLITPSSALLKMVKQKKLPYSSCFFPQLSRANNKKCLRYINSPAPHSWWVGGFFAKIEGTMVTFEESFNKQENTGVVLSCSQRRNFEVGSVILWKMF